MLKERTVLIAGGGTGLCIGLAASMLGNPNDSLAGAVQGKYAIAPGVGIQEWTLHPLVAQVRYPRGIC